MKDVTQQETDLSHSDNPVVAETAKDLLDARAARLAEASEEVGPATYSVLQEPEGFTPRKFFVERRVRLAKGGYSITIHGAPTEDQHEAEMLAFSAASDEHGAHAVSFIGDNIHVCARA